jgi:hypothetical protein
LNIVERFIAMFFTLDKIYNDCDVDGDNRISQHDMDHNAHTCLIRCFDAEMLFNVICDPAKAMNYKPKRVQCEPETPRKPVE